MSLLLLQEAAMNFGPLAAIGAGLAAVGGGAGLSDAVTSTSTGKPKFLGYE